MQFDTAFARLFIFAKSNSYVIPWIPLFSSMFSLMFPFDSHMFSMTHPLYIHLSFLPHNNHMTTGIQIIEDLVIHRRRYILRRLGIGWDRANILCRPIPSEVPLIFPDLLVP